MNPGSGVGIQEAVAAGGTEAGGLVGDRCRSAARTPDSMADGLGRGVGELSFTLASIERELGLPAEPGQGLPVGEGLASREWTGRRSHPHAVASLWSVRRESVTCVRVRGPGGVLAKVRELLPWRIDREGDQLEIVAFASAAGIIQSLRMGLEVQSLRVDPELVEQAVLLLGYQDTGAGWQLSVGLGSGAKAEESGPRRRQEPVSGLDFRDPGVSGGLGGLREPRPSAAVEPGSSLDDEREGGAGESSEESDAAAITRLILRAIDELARETPA